VLKYEQMYSVFTLLILHLDTSLRIYINVKYTMKNRYCKHFTIRVH